MVDIHTGSEEVTMSKYIIDLEADGLLDTITKVFVVVIKNISSGERWVLKTEGEIREGLAHIQDQHLIGHNLLGYDLQVLKRFFGFEVDISQVIDTLVLSRLIYPDMRARDARSKCMATRYWGSHSLEAWGYRLQKLKGDYGNGIDAFTELTQEMIDYCIQDVEVTEELYNVVSDKTSEQASDLEHKVAEVCYQQEHYGFPFDIRKAAALYAQLSERRSILYKELRDAFGSWVLDEGERKKGLYHKVKIVGFNPNSRQHIAKRLKELRGWEPVEFTPSGEAKVDEKVLNSLDFPEAQLMAEYFMINKRIGQLAEGDQAWLKLERNGRLHGRVNTMGSVTSRCSHSHPNTAQVPSVKAPYGKQCRELFKTDPGFSLLGCDVSGLELRCLAHYMGRFDSGAYGKILLDGDIHTANQEAAGLDNRDQAKTFIYGFLYGAGDTKIGQIVGKGGKEGKKLKDKFLTQLPALKNLKKAVQKRAKNGWVLGLDGRKVPIRHEHAALNTLLQSAGAIICKRWVVELDRMLQESDYEYGKDYAQVAFVHDEIQMLVREGIEDEIGRLAVSAIGVAGDTYKFRIPLTGEYKYGGSWSATH